MNESEINGMVSYTLKQITDNYILQYDNTVENQVESTMKASKIKNKLKRFFQKIDQSKFQGLIIVLKIKIIIQANKGSWIRKYSFQFYHSMESF